LTSDEKKIEEDRLRLAIESYARQKKLTPNYVHEALVRFEKLREIEKKLDRS
jgi:hypothetical protein